MTKHSSNIGQVLQDRGWTSTFILSGFAEFNKGGCLEFNQAAMPEQLSYFIERLRLGPTHAFGRNVLPVSREDFSEGQLAPRIDRLSSIDLVLYVSRPRDRVRPAGKGL